MGDRRMKKLKVMFCCARWLGIECLKLASKDKNIEIIGVSVPPSNREVWWKDVVDEKEIKKLKLNYISSDKIAKFIQSKKPDIVFSILTDYIFKEEDIDATKYGIINLHPAPLPYYRGCNSYAHAIMNGESQYGASMHYVSPGIDEGDIIKVDWMHISDKDTGRSLYNKTQILALSLFSKIYPYVIHNAMIKKRVPSMEQLEDKSRYYNRKSLTGIKDIPFNQLKLTCFDKLYSFVRALEFEPFEPSFIVHDGKKIYLTTTYNRSIR